MGGAEREKAAVVRILAATEHSCCIDVDEAPTIQQRVRVLATKESSCGADVSEVLTAKQLVPFPPAAANTTRMIVNLGQHPTLVTETLL